MDGSSGRNFESTKYLTMQKMDFFLRKIQPIKRRAQVLVHWSLEIGAGDPTYSEGVINFSYTNVVSVELPFDGAKDTSLLRAVMETVAFLKLHEMLGHPDLSDPSRAHLEIHFYRIFSRTERLPALSSMALKD